MSSLFEDISQITSSKKTPQEYEDLYVLPESNIHAQMEIVRLNEALRVLKYPNPSLYAIAKSMSNLAETYTTADPENEPVKTIKEASTVFAHKKHLQETWKAMGRFIENAHGLHGVGLKEMIGVYTDKQVDLLEMTLQLPWKLSYSQPLEVEVQDYAIPNQDHLFKGTEPEDVEANEAEKEIEEQSVSIKDRLKEALQESKKPALNNLVKKYIEKHGDANTALYEMVNHLSQNGHIKTLREYLQNNM